MKNLKIILTGFFIIAFMLTPAFTQAPQGITALNKAPQAVVTTGRKVYINYRAYPVAVDAVTARMVKEGDKVDILCALKAIMRNKKGTQPIVATLLQDITVLEVAEIKGLNYLIVQGSPIENQYLALASAQNIKVILRRKDDIKIAPIAISSFEDLGGAK